METDPSPDADPHTPAKVLPPAGQLPTVALSPEDWEALIMAHQHLEHPSLAARLSSLIGTPIEFALALLPKSWYDNLHGVAEAAVGKALDAAILSMRLGPQPIVHDHFYKALATSTGAAGGFFGLPALLVELPVTTTVILRSIADIARSQGEPLNELETRMECLKVFALGGYSEEDDATETGYYGVRLALTLSAVDAAQFIAQRGLIEEGAPLLARLITVLASRFGILLSQKVAAQLMPVIGAANGAFINFVFLQHFQDMARGHFTVRRLERKYGLATVRSAYDRLSSAHY